MRNVALAVTTTALVAAALTAAATPALATPTPSPTGSPAPSASASPTLPRVPDTLDPELSVGGPRLALMNSVIVDTPAGVPAPPDVSDVAWVIADADTGDILAAKNPHAHLLPASTLKTLTAIHLLPRIKPTAVLKATTLESNAEGTRVGMVAGGDLHGRAALPGPRHVVRERRGIRARRTQRRARQDGHRTQRPRRRTRSARHRRLGPQRSRRSRSAQQRLRPRPLRPGGHRQPGLPQARLDEDGDVPVGGDPGLTQSVELCHRQPQPAPVELPGHDRREERLHQGGTPHLHRSGHPRRQDLHRHGDVRHRQQLAPRRLVARLGLRPRCRREARGSPRRARRGH